MCWYSVVKGELASFLEAKASQSFLIQDCQSIGLEKIVCCAWRCKLAARLEARRLRILLEATQDREAQPEDAPDPARLRWYAASRQDLRGAIRILDDVRQEFERLGRISEERKENLDTLFGFGFYESLTRWLSMSKETILVAVHFAEHAKIFGKGPFCPDAEELTKTVVDPSQSFQMVTKLIDEKLQHLHDLNRSWDQRAAESAAAQAASPVDFAPRYFTTATRDLQRAVEWYLSLKENKL